LTALFLELLNDLARRPLELERVLPTEETGPHVRARALGQDVVTRQRGDRGHSFDALGDHLQLVGLGLRVRYRVAWGTLDDRIDHALVLRDTEQRGDLEVHAGRDRLLFDLLEPFLDLLDDRGGARAGSLLEHDGRRGMSVDVRVNIDELGT